MVQKHKQNTKVYTSGFYNVKLSTLHFLVAGNSGERFMQREGDSFIYILWFVGINLPRGLHENVLSINIIENFQKNHSKWESFTSEYPYSECKNMSLTSGQCPNSLEEREERGFWIKLLHYLIVFYHRESVKTQGRRKQPHFAFIWEVGYTPGPCW